MKGESSSILFKLHMTFILKLVSKVVISVHCARPIASRGSISSVSYRESILLVVFPKSVYVAKCATRECGRYVAIIESVSQFASFEHSAVSTSFALVQEASGKLWGGAHRDFSRTEEPEVSNFYILILRLSLLPLLILYTHYLHPSVSSNLCFFFV